VKKWGFYLNSFGVASDLKFRPNKNIPNSEIEEIEAAGDPLTA
jgi:hypothetical protein